MWHFSFVIASQASINVTTMNYENKEFALCDDACIYARDGVCDDGLEGAIWGQCRPGNDCSDCGLREQQTLIDLLNLENNYCSLSSLKSIETKENFQQIQNDVDTNASYANFSVANFHSTVTGNSKWITSRTADSGLGQIIGGETTRKNEFSFLGSIQGLLRFDGSRKAYCGAVLIDPSWAITAAHCHSEKTMPFEVSTWRSVVFGGHDLNSQLYDRDTCVQRRAFTIYNHPNYSSITQENDIALLHLQSPVSFEPINDFYDPADNHPVVSAGWGVVDQGTRLSAVKTQKVKLRIRNREACARIYMNGKYVVKDTHVCAGNTEETAGTCQGDSGGPLFVDEVYFDDRIGARLVGITSWAAGCANRLYPTVYTKVIKFKSWICANVCGNELQVCPPACQVVYALALFCRDCAFENTVGEMKELLRNYSRQSQVNIMYASRKEPITMSLFKDTYVYSNILDDEHVLKHQNSTKYNGILIEMNTTMTSAAILNAFNATFPASWSMRMEFILESESSAPFYTFYVFLYFFLFLTSIVLLCCLRRRVRDIDI